MAHAAEFEAVLQFMFTTLSVLCEFLHNQHNSMNRLHRIFSDGNEDEPSTIGALHGPRYKRQAEALLAGTPSVMPGFQCLGGFIQGAMIGRTILSWRHGMIRGGFKMSV